jgi:hypothetical protein
MRVRPGLIDLSVASSLINLSSKEYDMKLRTWPTVAAVSLSLLCVSAMSFGANGRIDAPENLARIIVGTTNAQQVQELLGTPLRTMKFPARGLQAMEYQMHDYSDWIIVSISIGNDGVVREVMRIRQSGA